MRGAELVLAGLELFYPHKLGGQRDNSVQVGMWQLSMLRVSEKIAHKLFGMWSREGALWKVLSGSGCCL